MMPKNSLSKIIGLGFLLSVLLCVTGLFLRSAGEKDNTTTEKTGVVATTSLIGSIVENIGKGRVNVTTIVPAGMCPGHLDIKPEEIKNIQDAGVVIVHGWERWIEKLIKSSKNRLPVRTVGIEENWMIPDVQIRAAEEIAGILTAANPDEKKWYQENLADYEGEVRTLTTKIEKIKKGSDNVKIICSSQQEGFLKWLGFKIVASYGRPEELSPGEIMGLIEEARDKNVTLVVDNLQSGADAGKSIAKEIGAKHITLTNFPLGDSSYTDALKENINKIGEALGWQKL